MQANNSNDSPASEFSFIIAGMGCSGLTMALRLSRSNLAFSNVLILDKVQKTLNDRTWCFWENTNEGWYEAVVSKRWDQFRFAAPGFEKIFQLHPYQYKLIKGLDFYSYCLKELKQDPRFVFVQDELLSIRPETEKVYVTCRNGTYSAPLLFNSVIHKQHIRSGEVNYVQHFVGWTVETEAPCFDDTCPVFMDFNTEQENDFRFFYLIPYSKTKALIEYTGFSPKALAADRYTSKLKHYLESHYPGIHYTVVETEAGSIPMAESAFINPYGKRVINIGTAGGHSKPSTGYTFYFIQKFTEHLLKQLESGRLIPEEPKRKRRFLFYDAIMLSVLNEKKVEGRGIFKRLFQKNKVVSLLKFLNEESSPLEEIRITGTMNKALFLNAAVKKWFKTLIK